MDAPTEIQYRTSATLSVSRPYSCPVAAMPDTIVTKPMAARAGAVRQRLAQSPKRGQGRTYATEEERVRLVPEHGAKDARVQRVAGNGEGREGGKEDHVEEEEGRADGAEGGMRRAPGEEEEQGVDDAGAPV